MEHTYSSLSGQLAQPYETVVVLLLPARFRATGRVDSRLGDKRIGGGGGHRTDPKSSALTEALTKTVAIQSTYESPRETPIAWHPSFDRAWAVHLLHEEETRATHDTSPVMVDIAPGLIIPITPDVLSPITNRQEYADDATLPPPPLDRTKPDASPYTAAQSHVAL
ncbi:hypothetical protein CH63R_11324 [Colletotrichum higginsianum IMI 349063]|uniref:Uncharacterized protein n=1 Tax=Colletotrichum higginsianum (strain IMI 349063) TaxID=759273 RepID=A0A1B7XY08_COLHI|nr:hypothetical protein CH63R_11324 [Colletotrichum higginsianum IMI 349063]OBR04621.1 hypothetical protein CH63R_11324 [Colletotrichum higginsianum IMI 349063]